MFEPLVYVDTSDVREGALEELKRAIAELADFVERSEPRLIAYSACFTHDGRRMSVVHVHADADSLDHHMEVAGPRFAAFAGLVELRSIHVHGQPSERALRALEEKARALGSGAVFVHLPHAGFGRWPIPPPAPPAAADRGARG